jgi:TolB-like protein/DNA-binding winged helix-turn-helix (wHTH) protein/Tfp pilus assembly protein PilF
VGQLCVYAEIVRFQRIGRHLLSVFRFAKACYALSQRDTSLTNPADLPRVLRFGQFELDLRTAEIYKEGKRIKMQEQPRQVLAVLIERPGELVWREELRKKLWPNDRFVDFDHGVNIAISKLRDALGDAPEKPRFIETLPRRGYRFIAAVETIPSAPYEDLTARTEHVVRARRPVIPGIAAVSLAAILALVVGLNIGGVRQRFLRTSAARTVQSVAVLPLENLSGDTEQAYFAEGMTDELITSLAKLQTLRVISRGSVMRYKGTSKPLPEIARELNVDGIIEGTVLRSGNRVRITAQLIRAATDQHLWAETYEGNMEDVLRLQDAVAQAIAAEIRFKLEPEAKAHLAKSPSVNPAAYEAYLRGRYHFYDRWTKAGSLAASHYFEEAIAKDPQYAPAYAGLADYYTLGGFTDQLFTNREAMERARELAAKALQLDDRSADAHIAMANVLFRYDWNWTEAEKEFKRGIELNLNAPSSYSNYAMYLGVLGRFDEAIAAMKRAIELDPFSAVINSGLGVVLQWSGRDDKAAEQECKAIALDSFFPQAHLVLARAYEQLSKYDEATAEHLETDTLDGIDPSAVAGFKRAYMSSGINGYRQRRMEWEKQRARSGKANYHLIALLSAQLGDRDAAFQWLEKAYQQRLLTMPNIKVAPGLRSLHGDPRFADLVRRVGLPP